MFSSQKHGGISAFANAVVAAATLIVALVLIGPAALIDPTKLIEMAINNPAPLILQDLLKIISAGISVILILVLLKFLNQKKSIALRIGASAGFLAVICLIANAAMSLYAISKAPTFLENGEAGMKLNLVITIFGLATLILNGIWLLILHWVAIKTKCLPKALAYLGLTMGTLSLLPPFGILVLLLSIVWSIWIGMILINQ
jgi:Domain of unknown function (DUF4386)